MSARSVSRYSPVVPGDSAVDDHPKGGSRRVSRPNSSAIARNRREIVDDAEVGELGALTLELIQIRVALLAQRDEFLVGRQWLDLELEVMWRRPGLVRLRVFRSRRTDERVVKAFGAHHASTAQAPAE